MRRVCLFVVGLLIMTTAVAGAGCGAAPGEGGRIEGIRWVLKSYDSDGAALNAPAGVEVDVLFEAGNVSGFSGVNTYRGEYKLSGSKLTIGKLASTLMAGPQDLMDLEQAYLSAMERTASFTAEDEELTLFDSDGRLLLEYGKGKGTLAHRRYLAGNKLLQRPRSYSRRHQRHHANRGLRLRWRRNRLGRRQRLPRHIQYQGAEHNHRHSDNHHEQDQRGSRCRSAGNRIPRGTADGGRV